MAAGTCRHLRQVGDDKNLIGHVVMGMASHSHRDSIYAAQGMRWRAGLGYDVFAADLFGTPQDFELAVSKPVDEVHDAHAVAIVLKRYAQLSMESAAELCLADT